MLSPSINDGIYGPILIVFREIAIKVTFTDPPRLLVGKTDKPIVPIGTEACFVPNVDLGTFAACRNALPLTRVFFILVIGSPMTEQYARNFFI